MCYVRLMQEYRLRELFKPSMAELGLCIWSWNHMLQVSRPRWSCPPTPHPHTCQPHSRVLSLALPESLRLKIPGLRNPQTHQGRRGLTPQGALEHCLKDASGASLYSGGFSELRSSPESFRPGWRG